MIEEEDWIQKYRAALLEKRREKLAERIEEAKRAINERERQLETDTAVGLADRRLLKDARDTLDALGRRKR